MDRQAHIPYKIYYVEGGIMKRLLALAVLVLFAAQPAYAETVKINLHSC